MKAKLFKNGRSQAVRLPKVFRFEGKEVEIKPWGDGVLLTPVKPKTWSVDFFEKIHISDEKFIRPDQEITPNAPSWS